MRNIIIKTKTTSEWNVKPKRTFTVQQLPMWGEKVSQDQINFRWPSQQALDAMPEDVRLEKLIMKASALKVISSV